jgi:hypothetical protein
MFRECEVHNLLSGRSRYAFCVVQLLENFSPQSENPYKSSRIRKTFGLR